MPMALTRGRSPNPANAPDLDAYFERIGYTGARAASLDTLEAIHLLHPRAIAFENLDPFLGRPVSLETEALNAKLVHGDRGGYCFEQNLLLMFVLESLGLTVGGLAARVLWGRPEGAMTPRTHMLLRVEIGGRTWLADVGFGGLTLTAPLLLEPGRVQPTPHGPFRVVETGGYFLMQAEVGGRWRDIYRFDLSEHHRQDYTITSHYLSTHHASPFVAGLMAARALPDRRLALAGNRLTVHHLGGESVRSEISSAAGLADVLEKHFGVAVPDRAAFETMVLSKGVIVSPA